MILAMCVLGLLGAVFVAALGVLISLPAARVRQAQQSLGGAIMVLLVLPIGVARLLPAAWTGRVISDAGNAAYVPLVGVVACVALDVAVVALALARFQRTRLIAR